MEKWSPEELQALGKIKNANTRDFQNLLKNKTQFEIKRKWRQVYNQDPNDSEWTQEQLQSLFTLYHTFNSQWSLIQQKISSKNRIKIRNKFYETLRNLIRFLLRYFNIRSGEITTISTKIKPVILQRIYNSSEEFQFSNSIVKKAISSMNFIVDKEKLASLVSENKEVFQNIVSIILGREIKPQTTSSKMLTQTTVYKMLILRNKKTQTLQNKDEIKLKECSQVVEIESMGGNYQIMEQPIQGTGNPWFDSLCYCPLQFASWVIIYPQQAPDYQN